MSIPPFFYNSFFCLKLWDLSKFGHFLGDISLHIIRINSPVHVKSSLFPGVEILFRGSSAISLGDREIGLVYGEEHV